jgi:hypothetical protein
MDKIKDKVGRDNDGPGRGGHHGGDGPGRGEHDRRDDDNKPGLMDKIKDKVKRDD